MLNKNKQVKFTFAKQILLFLLSIVFLYYSFLTIETRLNNILIVNIPLYTNFPIPVLFWIGVFVYLVALSRLFNKDLKNLAWPGVLLGFTIHFTFLLLNAYKLNVSNQISWSSGYYRYYFMVFLYLSLSVLSIWSGILFYFSVIGRNNIYFSLFYSIPLLFILSSLSSLICRNYLLYFIMVSSFLLSLYSRANERLFFKVKRIISSFSRIVFDERIFLPLIFITSMVFKIVMLKQVMTNPNYILTASDGRHYNRYAREFLEGKSVKVPYTKGYWIFLSGLYYIFNKDYFSVGVVQSIYGSLAVLMTYLIAKKAFGIVTARIAAIIAVLDYPLIFAAVGLGHQAMDIFYSILIAYLLIKYKAMGITLKSTFFLIFIGFMSGLATANREVNVLMPLIASAWLIYVFYKSGYKKMKIAGIISLFLLFVILGMAPFLYSNYLETGSLYDQTTNYGIKKVLTAFNPQLENIGFDPHKSLGSSIRVLLAKPSLLLTATWKNYSLKFMNLYFSQVYGSFDPIFLFRKPISNYYLSMYFYAYLVTLIGFIFGYLNRKKNNKVIIYLLFLIIAYKTVVHVVTVSYYRYRPPIELFLIIFTAYGLYVIIQHIGDKIKALSIDGR